MSSSFLNHSATSFAASVGSEEAWITFSNCLVTLFMRPNEPRIVPGAACSGSKVPAFKPHLIVLDLMMPLLDGFGVIHKLQEQGFSSIPIVVITGYSDQASESLVSNEPNVVAFLRKPLKFDELTAKLNGLLAG